MTTGTLTATPNTTDMSVQLSLAWTGIAFATVARVAADGTIINVRNAEPAQTDGAGAWIGFDYEAPLDISFSYQATSTTWPGDVTTSASTSLPSAGATWLRHPGQPLFNRPVTVASPPALERPAVRGVFDVLGRSRPVVTTGRRQSPRGDLQVHTSSDAERDDLANLVEDGSVLLLSTPDGRGMGNWYVAVGDVKEDRYSRLLAPAERLWTLPFVVVDRPAGSAVATGNSWSDALGAYASWQELAAAEGTWAGLLTGVG